MKIFVIIVIISLQQKLVKSSRINCTNEICLLKNVFYNSTTLSFVVPFDKNTCIKGIKNYKQLQKIQLSSIKNHNAFFANITLLETDRIVKAIRYKNIFGIARFKSDNIMHVIHDDIFPLFITLGNLYNFNWTLCRQEIRLFFLDSSLPGPYEFLYTLFTNYEPIYKINVNKIIFIENLYLGLNKSSIWYQYGFSQPRGPTNKFNVDYQTLLQFQKFVKDSLKIEGIAEDIIFLERRETRRILNMNKIEESLTTLRKIVNVSRNNTKEILLKVSNAKLVVGVHGADLIYTIFMKPGTKVIEIFPFGVHPNAVSFLKPILSKFGIQYSFWINPDRKSSIFHPEYPPHLGGLKHLSSEVQLDITSSVGIDHVYCCDDAKFLYFMYQDTILGTSFYKFFIKEFKELEQREIAFEFLKFCKLLKPGHVYQTMSEQDEAIEENCHRDIDSWLYPGKPQDVQCRFGENFLTAVWQAPDNIKSNLLKYSVTIQILGKIQAFVTADNFIKIPVDYQTNAQLWISAVYVVNNHSSIDVFTSCS